MRRREGSLRARGAAPSRVWSSLQSVGPHGRVLGLGLVMGSAVALVAPGAPERSEAGVAALLGEAVGGNVGDDAFVWEESAGAVVDGAWGRRVLFVAELPTASGGRQRDVFRARVRVSRQGRPLAVASFENLTRSDEDEDGLIARGTHAAFRTRSTEGVVSVTLLDLEGAAPFGETRAMRWLSAADAYLETGSPRGLSASIVAFADRPEIVEIELTDTALVMGIGGEKIAASMPFGAAAIESGGHGTYGATVRPLPRPVRSLQRIAVREIGARFGRAAALAARELWHWGDRSTGADGAAPIATPDAEAPTIAFAPKLADDAPFRALPARVPISLGAGDAAPPFAVGLRRVRDASIHAIAIDTRQVELRAAAGFEADAPLPATGVGGVAAADVPQVIAAFAGTTPWPGDPGAGAVFEGTLLTPPAVGLPTMVVDRRGDARVGAWPDYPALPTFVSALRQEPRFEVFPEWETERAGLCALETGHWLYAWSKRAARADVEELFSEARCTVALHFGAPLESAGFVLMDSPPVAVHPDMSIRAESLFRDYPYELYYWVARRPLPPIKLPGGIEWNVAAGTNPTPDWLPSMYEASVESLGVDVTVTAIAPGRFEWRLAAGEKERKHRLGGVFEIGLSAPDAERMLASISIGNGRRKRTSGLSLAGSRAHRFRGAAGLLWVDGARLEIGLSDDAPETLPGDATELPLTADAGRYEDAALAPGSLRERAALCVGPEGWVLLARARFDTDEVTTKTLLEVGCRRVVALDRGAPHRPDLRRTGTPEPPSARSSSTALYLLNHDTGGTIQRL